MKPQMCCFLIVFLQIISQIASHHQDKIPAFHEAAFESYQGKGEGVYGNEETYSRMLGRLGSKPPNCHRKCGSCTPCVAIQIPATSDELGIQYTNYEPEGWKCKCGSTFFNP